MVLQKESLRLGRMTYDLVHALSKLRILLALGQKLRAHTNVSRFPRFATIFGAIEAARTRAAAACAKAGRRFRANPRLERVV